jgi:hypothetical protein
LIGAANSHIANGVKSLFLLIVFNDGLQEKYLSLLINGQLKSKVCRFYNGVGARPIFFVLERFIPKMSKHVSQHFSASQGFMPDMFKIRIRKFLFKLLLVPYVSTYAYFTSCSVIWYVTLLLAGTLTALCTLMLTQSFYPHLLAIKHKSMAMLITSCSLM